MMRETLNCVPHAFVVVGFLLAAFIVHAHGLANAATIFVGGLFASSVIAAVILALAFVCAAVKRSTKQHNTEEAGS